MLFRFELVSVSENYGDYLAALEIPAYLIYFIQSSAESMIFEVIGDSWRWEIDKGQFIARFRRYAVGHWTLCLRASAKPFVSHKRRQKLD